LGPKGACEQKAESPPVPDKREDQEEFGVEFEDGIEGRHGDAGQNDDDPA
jgi:hypothetical protein